MRPPTLPPPCRVDRSASPPCAGPEALALVTAVFQRARVDALGLRDTNPQAHHEALRWFFAATAAPDILPWCELAGLSLSAVRQALWAQLAPCTRTFVTQHHGYRQEVSRV